MKRNVWLILLVLLTTFSYGQDVVWHVKGGLNISNYTVEDDKAKMGFRVGGGFEHALDPVWGIQPSLMLTSKGTKVEVYGLEAKVNAIYLELPVMFTARLLIDNKNNNVVFSAGPYLACGVGGKTSISSNGIKMSTDTFSSNVADLRRFDCGVGLGIGLEVGSILVGLDAQFGFINVVDDVTAKNMNFSLGVGYKFWK